MRFRQRLWGGIAEANRLSGAADAAMWDGPDGLNGLGR